MKDTDKVLGNDVLVAPHSIHDSHEIERLKIEPLKTKLQLDQSHTAYKQSKEDSRKLKKLLKEVTPQKSREKRLQPTVDEDKKAGEPSSIHQVTHNLTADSRRCEELEQEVAALYSVLEIHTAELHELRRQCAAAEQQAKQLAVALKANSTLEFEIECLKMQLNIKSSNEQTLIQEKKTLLSSFQYESDQNRRLSLCNEELRWKLRQNVTLGDRSSPLLKPVAHSTPTPTIQIDGHCQQCSSEYSRSPHTKEHIISQSPQVYGVVKKKDSISWIIDIKEQEKDDSVSICPGQQIFKSSKKTIINSSKFSPDQVKIPKTCLTHLCKKIY